MVLFAFFLSWMMTGWYYKYAVNNHILDIPNHRSAHVTPIPRGGGVVFVLIFSCLAFASASFHGLMVFLPFMVAVIGFCDDRWSLPAHYRFVAQMLFASVALWMLGGMPPIEWMGMVLHQHAMLAVVGVIYVVWMLNLYNFMDGLDGLAGVQAVCVCLGMAFLYAWSGHLVLVKLPMVLAAAVSGFLMWNFPRAKIFMGDAGSCFLGFLFAMWSLQAAWTAPVFFWSWLIMMGVFVTDTTLTLLFRMLAGKPIYMAHRTHAYQHAAFFYKSHIKVTCAVLAINMFWLLPIAWMVSCSWVDGFCGLLLAYTPLVGVALIFNAGRSSKSSHG